MPSQNPQSPASPKGATTRSRRGAPPHANGSEPPPPAITDTSLADEAQRRYLNYALSVITSRALPDVRDGLKPVQRRILYAMHNDLHLGPDAKPRKSAAVVGDVMGKYHPHGDASIYEAMVRLAQDWAMRAPLVHGHGNFGSLDGDSPAAMRYTECKLLPLALDLLGEIGRRTVSWRPNYDGTRSEPIVLPARFPNLLVNGSQGIAVGMATSIPPHNLGEVIDACIALINNDRELPLGQLLKSIKGPDFPTGGQLQATRKELEAVYTSGQGSLRLRGEYRVEDAGDKKGAPPPLIIITSIPYGVERKAIVEKIAEVVITKKLPTIVDMRDESTAEVRIVLEIKRGADPQLIMAYLYKNTPMATHVQVNLTCLVPVPASQRTGSHAIGEAGADETEIAAPRRLGLAEMLGHFLDFRFETVKRRTEFDLAEIRKKIHILEGLEKVFDALDEVIRIIRKSEGRPDAAQKLMTRFKLSEEQVDAILELRLYRLARLEILIVQKELAERRAEAKRLDSLLNTPKHLWDLVKSELQEIKAKYADKRRTKVLGAVDEPEYQAEDFIVAEDANIILSAQGWVKRVREVKDLATTRLREGDSVFAAVAASTRSVVAFFSNLGGCYSCRVTEIPASTGYGDPVQKLFKLADGERMIAMLSFDPRVLDVPAPTEGAEDPEEPLSLAMTKAGFGFRFSLRTHRDPSTRAGRRFAKPKEGDEVLAVFPVHKGDIVVCASGDGHALAVAVKEIPALVGAGKGAIVMDVTEGDRLIGAQIAPPNIDRFKAETDKGKEKDFKLSEVMGSRANRGTPISKRDALVRLVLPPLEAPTFSPDR